MCDNKKSTIKVVDNIKETKYSNVVQVGFTETEFMINFGKLQLQDNEQLIEVVAKVAIPIEKLLRFVGILVNLAAEYEKHFKKDIGFGFLKQNDDLTENTENTEK